MPHDMVETPHIMVENASQRRLFLLLAGSIEGLPSIMPHGMVETPHGMNFSVLLAGSIQEARGNSSQ